MEQKGQNFVLKIILSILLFVPSGLFAILAFIFTLLANGKFKAGDFEEGKKKGKLANIFLIIGAIWTFFGVIVTIIFGVFLATNEDFKDKFAQIYNDSMGITTESTTEAYVTTEATTTEATTTEATTEAGDATTEASDATTATTTSSAVSDTWSDYQICVDGVVYTIPCSINDFVANGWVVDADDASFIVNVGTYTYTYLEKNGVQISVDVVNPDPENFKMVSECDVFSVGFDDWEELDPAAYYIAKGIHIGSTYEEVIAAYGTPSDEYVDEDSDYGYKSLTYEVDGASSYYQSLSITISEGLVSDITLENDGQ